MEVMENADRGEWCLIPVLNKVANLDQLKCQHQNRMKTIAKANRTPFEYLRNDTNKAANADFIFWKDSMVVIFHANCLKLT